MFCWSDGAALSHGGHTLIAWDEGSFKNNEYKCMHVDLVVYELCSDWILYNERQGNSIHLLYTRYLDDYDYYW